MRRAHVIAAWVTCTAIGVLLLALPDRGPRLLTFSQAHGPGVLDLIGAALASVGSALVWWWIWRDRRRLAAAPPWLQLSAPIAAGLGLGLVLASVLSDFSAWWAVGAALITVVQVALFTTVSTGNHRPLRVRATGYVTRGAPDQLELLTFEYPSEPGWHLPGGGVLPGELLNDAIIREAVEETGVLGPLAVRSVVGVQQGRYGDTRRPYLNVFFHLHSTEQRDQWEHTIIGDPHAWDTGITVTCRFTPLARATQALRNARQGQHAFIDLLPKPTNAARS